MSKKYEKQLMKFELTKDKLKMEIKLNSDEEVVKMIKEGLEKSGGYCPCRREKTQENKCTFFLRIFIQFIFGISGC